MNKKRFGQYLAIALSAAMVFSAGKLTAEAENSGNSSGVTARDIVEYAGNYEMKTYGISLEEGTQALVDKSIIPSGSGTSYYVDSVGGDDSNEGTSENSAWKTFEKVNATTFQPGDRILLKGGSEWNTTLSPKGSGKKDQPIFISAYGEGNLPKLTGHALTADMIYLENQEYWDISNLEISNQADGFTGTQGELLKDVRGIRIAADPGNEESVLTGYHLHHLYVHDVSGEVKWIGGSGTVSPGVEKGGGWDGSKRTGGIVFEVLAPEEGKQEQPVIFSDITIEKNVLNNNSFGGIMIKQWKGDKRGTNESWANRESGNHWTPHKNVVIQDNYLSQKASNFACNTIYLTSIDGATVQRNVSREAGTCGIEMYYTDNTVVQYNEVYDTRVKAGGADSNAIDPDKLATNALIQYNYIHDTGDGILLCGFVEGSSVVRYNVIQDAEKRYLNPHGDKGENYIYNNIFYNSKGGADFVKTSGDNRYYNDSNNFYYFYNNIFYNASDESGTINILDGSSVQYDNNCYYGKNVSAPSNEKNAFLTDPEFIDSDISGAREDLSALANLKLKETSPLLGMGRKVEVGNIKVEAGETDFFGKALNDPASVGIAEYDGEKAIVKGYVTDEFDNKVAGAEITLENGSQTTTDENGYYQLVGLEAGEYQATVSMAEYYKDVKRTVTAEKGKVTLQNLKTGECTVTTGAVSGTVTCDGKPVAEAKVNITGTGTNQSEEITKTVQTDADGKYSVQDIPVGKAYTITVTKKGYDRKAVKEIEVQIMGNTVTDITLTKEVTTPVYSINEDFSSYELGIFTENSSYELGIFTENDVWGITDPGAKGSITIEEENGNKYLHLAKTDASAVAALFNKEELGLTGTLTIEARVKRTDNGSGNNQYGLYSFGSADWAASDPSSSKNPMATIALSKGKIQTHNVSGKSTTVDVQNYDTNQWYIIRNVVDLNSGTFDFYVDDMETPKLTEQPLRTVRDTLDYINLYSGKNNSGDLCVDYIRVCKGISYGYADTGLSGLTADGVEITKAKDGTFLAEVSAETEQIAVTPVLDNAFANVSINGTAWDRENPITVQLQEGKNEIPVVVTAESGETKEYQLHVERKALATVGYLKSLSIENVTLSPEFQKDTEAYTAKTSMETVRLNYEKVAETSKVEVTVNNSKVDNPQEIPLQNGDNTISVYVESEDGADNITYTIQINCKAIEKMPDAYEDVVINENFDEGSSEHFGFNNSSAIENGQLVLTGTQQKASVSEFSADVSDRKAVDFSFDWSSDGNNKTGIEFRDKDGKLIFALCAGKTDLRPSVTGGAAADGETVEPAWTTNQITWTKGTVYTVRVRADFEKHTVSYRIGEKGGEVLYQQLDQPLDAVNLARMGIGVWYAPKTQYIDNFVLTAPGADTPIVPEPEKKIESIELSQLPEKVKYTKGEELDTKGLEVTVIYNDQSKDVITEGFVVTGYDADKIGEQEITVTYQEYTATYQVTVAESSETQPEPEKTLVSIEIATPPVKTEYVKGEIFDPSGLVIKAVYSDGSEENVDTGFEVSGYNQDLAGEQTITVSYNGQTASFQIMVKEVSQNPGDDQGGNQTDPGDDQGGNQTDPGDGQEGKQTDPGDGQEGNQNSSANSQSGNPTSGDKQIRTAPRTGDEAPVVLWFGFALTAFVIILVSLARRRKKR